MGLRLSSHVLSIDCNISILGPDDRLDVLLVASLETLVEYVSMLVLLVRLATNLRLVLHHHLLH